MFLKRTESTWLLFLKIAYLIFTLLIPFLYLAKPFSIILVSALSGKFLTVFFFCALLIFPAIGFICSFLLTLYSPDELKIEFSPKKRYFFYAFCILNIILILVMAGLWINQFVMRDGTFLNILMMESFKKNTFYILVHFLYGIATMRLIAIHVYHLDSKAA